jgi:undecaprenyl-diphosphatase
VENGPVTSLEGIGLLPSPVHRPAAALACLCSALALALAVSLHGHDTYTGLDEWIVGSLPYPESHRTALTHLADLVPPVFVLVVVGLVAGLLVRRDGSAAALALLGPGLSMFVTEGGKRLVGRTMEGQLSLPSGHTTGVTSVSLVVVLLLARTARRHVAAAYGVALSAATLAGLGIGTVMVLLRFHYPTDILAGWAVAIACTLGTALAIDRVARGRAIRDVATG